MKLLEVYHRTQGENIGREGRKTLDPVPKSPSLRGQWRKSQQRRMAREARGKPAQCVLGVTELKDRFHWTSFPSPRRAENSLKMAEVKRIYEKMLFNIV